MLNLKSEDVELFLREDRNVHWFSLKIRGWGTSTASALCPLTTCDRQPVNIAIALQSLGVDSELIQINNTSFFIVHERFQLN